MASIFVHAALPLVPGRALDWPETWRRRILIAGVACAVWPDLDLATLALEMRPEDTLGHRGATHSILVAAIVALVVGAALFRGLKIASRPWWRVVAFLFAAGASHGLLDAMTAGDIGVALLAPVTNHRFLLPLKLVAVCPGGINEYFGAMGALTLANELLYVVLPLALITTYVREVAVRRRVAVLGAVWAAIALLLRTQEPKLFAPTMPLRLAAATSNASGRLEEIPHADLPDGRLVTRLAELRERGLVGARLVPASTPWSSSFFPSWFGGAAGRWQEGAPTLVWRTTFGYHAPNEQEAKAWLTAAANGDAAAQQRIATLAPTEKVDIAFGDFDFPATRQVLAWTHNRWPKPRYWYGVCHGASTAGLDVPEPFHAVDVISVGGYHVRFHPNDIKALLAVGYSDTEFQTIGEVCEESAFDGPAACAVNPAVLVVALLNRIGLAHRSFLIDALPAVASQNYPVAEAEVRLVREPYPFDHRRMDRDLEGRVESLADVEIDLVLSSTTLSYRRVDRVETPVGLVPVRKKYKATLALDKNTELLGGEWTGDPADGPDYLTFVREEPNLAPYGMLRAAHQIRWSFVSQLARASADPTAASPTLDLR